MPSFEPAIGGNDGDMAFFVAEPGPFAFRDCRDFDVLSLHPTLNEIIGMATLSSGP